MVGSAAVAPPADERAADPAEDGAERTGDEDPEQRALVGLGLEDHRAEEAAEETDTAEDGCAEQGVDEPTEFRGGGGHGSSIASD